MMKLNTILYLLFATPMAVFAQSNYCFPDRSQAETKFQELKNHCTDTDGGIVLSNSFLSLMSPSEAYSGQWCVGVGCNTCKSSTEYKRLAQNAYDYCCDMGKKLLPFPSSFQCSNMFVGIGYGRSNFNINWDALCSDESG